MIRLAIVTTHPIQYYAPVFKLLYERKKIDIKVFYTMGEQRDDRIDYGFGKAITWDIPLLDGYPFEWVENIASTPGSHHYKGIDNPGLVQQVQVWKPDAVLVFGWAYKSHLAVIRYFKNKYPVYFRGDSTLLDEPNGIKKILKYIFLKWVYKHIDHAFYVGINNKAYFKKYGLKDEQLSFTPHAIDNIRFENNHLLAANQLRSSFNIKSDEILILYAGKFEEVKNVELLLSAFINLKKDRVHLLLVGNGIKEASLKEMASSSGMNSSVHFLEFQNQSYMPVLYQAADLFCLPSLSETWGLAVNEAMACGKAILVSNKVGCAVDLVKENYNGAIFSTEIMNDLVNCLEQLTHSKKLLQEYGSNSKRMINEWNFLKIAEAIENKLNEKI